MEQVSNRGSNERDRIIFGEPFHKELYRGGIRRFEKLTATQIKKLMDAGLVDEMDAQNHAPTAGEICKFILDHGEDGWYAHGYTVSPDRSDYRITLEGVGKSTAPTKQDIIEFRDLFQDADELHVRKDSLFCWYD